MLRPLMVAGCLLAVLRPACSASHLYGDVEPRWQREVRALLEASNMLQPSGPGHGSSEDDDDDDDDDGDNFKHQDREDLELEAKKRALSALSRWKPFTSAWTVKGVRPNGREPLVSAKTYPEAGLVLALARAQLRSTRLPLRYGRRRRR